MCCLSVVGQVSMRYLSVEGASVYALLVCGGGECLWVACLWKGQVSTRCLSVEGASVFALLVCDWGKCLHVASLWFG